MKLPLFGLKMVCFLKLQELRFCELRAVRVRLIRSNVECLQHCNLGICKGLIYVDFFVHHSALLIKLMEWLRLLLYITNGVSKGEKIKNLLMKNFS